MPGIILPKEFFEIKGAIVRKNRMENGTLVLTCQPQKKYERICPYCGAKCKHYDYGKIRRWKHVAKGTSVIVETRTERIRCSEHGVKTVKYPWAKPGFRFTESMEETIAEECREKTFRSVARTFGLSQNTVPRVVDRVLERIKPKSENNFGYLVYIAIDETSYTKGHNYVMVVVNHNTGDIVWTGKGHSQEELAEFFEKLTPEQRASIMVVSADAAQWIQQCIDEYLPNAVKALDPFHVVSWVTTELDNVRKEEIRIWQKEMERLVKKIAKLAKKPVKKHGEDCRQKKAMQELTERMGKLKTMIKGAKYPLLKNPENLTENQSEKLGRILEFSPRLKEAYMLKEQIRSVFKSEKEDGKKILDAWIKEAENSKISRFQMLSQKIRRNYDGIMTVLETKITNARIEAVNNKIKLTIRMAYGFRKVDTLIMLIKLRYYGLKIRGNEEISKAA